MLLTSLDPKEENLFGCLEGTVIYFNKNEGGHFPLRAISVCSTYPGDN